METESILKPPLSKIMKAGRVILKPGEEIGTHKTTQREELLIVLKGEATIIYGSKTTTLIAGQAHFIPENIMHNVKNSNRDMLEYIYIVSLFS